MIRRSYLAAGLVAAGLVGWYLFRPERLFTTTVVNESLPAATEPAAEMQVIAAAMPASEVNDEMPAAGAAPTAVLSGRFRGYAHETSGTATIYRLDDGRHLLRLTDFATSNGPDVQVYLVAAPDATDDETVKRAGFVPLGAMKGNRGNQNYELPAGVDLAKYRAVTIWCRRFSVNFGTAPLSPTS